MVGVLDKDAQLLDAQLDKAEVVHLALGDRVDALVQERHGRRARDDVADGLGQLLGQAGLEGDEGAKELDDLDKHPVVGRVGQDLEQLRGLGQVVLGVLAGELADDVDGRRHDG